MKIPSLPLRYSFFDQGGALPTMIQLNKNGWELVAGIVSVAVLSAGAIWLLKRKRPTEAEL